MGPSDAFNSSIGVIHGSIGRFQFVLQMLSTRPSDAFYPSIERFQWVDRAL